MTALTERQKKALALKGNHKIYFEDDTRDNQRFLEYGEIDEDRFEEIKNVRVVADLDEVEIISMTEIPDEYDGRAFIPDYTPDWLADIISLWSPYSFADSMFDFASKEDADEFKTICDVVNE